MSREYEQLSDVALEIEIRNTSRGAREFEKECDREKARELYFDLLKERNFRKEQK